MYLYSKVSCIICHQEFPIKGIHSHFIYKHTQQGGELIKKTNAIIAAAGGAAFKRNCEIRQTQKEIDYCNDPNLCFQCDSALNYVQRNNKFCSRSCAATNNNAKRVHTDQTKQKLRVATTARYANRYKPISHEYSKIFTCTCSHCGIVFVNRSQRKYCVDHRMLYQQNGRSLYQFTFNVYHYPHLLDLSLIQQYGWRKTKGPNVNINGVTRDHRVSVNDAIKHNYDPYYIKHPINCQLMLFEDNNKKNTKSSISYDELIRLVNAYDS